MKRIIFVIVILLGVFLIFGSRIKHTPPILMYHHVAANDELRADTVSPESFEQVMAYIQREEYAVIPLGEMADKRLAGESIDKKTIAITFDDGYEDNYTHAFPILKKYNFPATIFVTYDYIDKRGYLTKAQMHEMKRSGLITFGSHTLTHAYLPELNTAQLNIEIKSSKDVLEHKLGTKIDMIAYPSGGFTDEVKEMVERSGYKAGFTTNRGKEKDLFEIKRIAMRERDASRWIYMWAKLSGHYNAFRKTKKPY